MRPILPWYCGCFARLWKMPSAMVDRQMLPRQTKSTDTGSGILAAASFLQVFAGKVNWRNIRVGVILC